MEDSDDSESERNNNQINIKFRIKKYNINKNFFNIIEYTRHNCAVLR